MTYKGTTALMTGASMNQVDVNIGAVVALSHAFVPEGRSTPNSTTPGQTHLRSITERTRSSSCLSMEDFVANPKSIALTLLDGFQFERNRGVLRISNTVEYGRNIMASIDAWKQQQAHLIH